jgi:SAM-dependent methyltransferase
MVGSVAPPIAKGNARRGLAEVGGHGISAGMSVPLVFDRRLVRHRLSRALAQGYVDFLVARALEDLADRLGAVLRPFALAADLGTPTSAATDWLRRSGRAGTVVRLAPAALGASPGLTVIGDEEALPFGGERFDLAISLLALHAVNDLPGSLLQIRRLLKPDGLFLGSLLGGATLAELRQAFAEAESEVERGISPRVAPFADLRDIGALVQRAGFALPVVDIEALTVRYPDAFALMRELRAMGFGNALADRRKEPLRRATLMRAAAIYAERFSDPDGRVRATFELIWLSGWAPHASQQKPLRPGSAQARLADALGTTERAAGEKAG